MCGLGLMCGILVLNIRNIFGIFLIFSIIIQSLIVMAGVMGWITIIQDLNIFISP